MIPSAEVLAFCRGIVFGRTLGIILGRRFLFCRRAKIDLRLNTGKQTLSITLYRVAHHVSEVDSSSMPCGLSLLSNLGICTRVRSVVNVSAD